VLLINFFEIQKVPQKDSFTLIINYKIDSSYLLFSKNQAYYRVQYDILSNNYIINSQIFDYKFDSLNSKEVDLKLAYDKKYKLNFKIIDLNANSYLIDTTFDIFFKSNDYFLLGDIKTDKFKYSSTDSLMNIFIPIYSKISDSVEFKIIVENDKKVEKRNYKIYLNEGFNEIKLSYNIKHLRLDRYEAIINLIYKKLKLSQKFSFYKLGMLNMTKDELDNLIFSLNYLYSGEFSKYLKRNNNDLEKAWNEFWNDKDPTPNTQLNESKEVFLERYRYVIKNFMKNNRINAMGLIYLKYGPPDYIEKSEINIYDRPYQIWYYESLNLRFIFVDKYGTGDYELAPINWYNNFR